MRGPERSETAKYGSCRSNRSSASERGRRGPTRSSGARLKEAQARAVADPGLRGASFGRTLSEAIDEAIRDAAAGLEISGRWALVALGSYGRRELCPGSDVDVMLVHDGGARGAAGNQAAEALWYPLWDAGFVLGHAVRTPKEALALARDDVDTLTGLLEVRVVAGDEELVADLVERVRGTARKRRRAVVDVLAEGAARRQERPGPVAEMLEPNLKDGAGGLRDLQALEWVGWALDEAGGRHALLDAQLLQPADPVALDTAKARLLDARVALHRATGARSDLLTLQEQDAVAAELGYDDADDLVRDLAAAARTVTWIATDVWHQLAKRGKDRSNPIEIDDGDVPDALSCLRAARTAAEKGEPLDRAVLERFRDVRTPVWDAETRQALVDLLRVGRRAIPVLESLDQVGVLEALLPEWRFVRAKPQRNAYHRFTVDRHLLEAVAECAAVLDDESFDGDVARRAPMDLLLFGALLHDIGKGLPDADHSVSGTRTARVIGTRIGLDDHAVDVLAWLVRHHLLMADTATRRDLSDEETITRFGRAVRDTERLDLLYALTIGDSRATGPAAWGTAKSMLVRQLFRETDTLLEQGVVRARSGSERSVALDRHRALLDAHEIAVRWEDRDDGLLECVVVAPDRPGVLATVAGVLAVHGYDIRGASAYGDETGMALEVYRGVDTFGRLDAEGRAAVEADVSAALGGDLSVRDRLDERIRRYRREPSGDDTVRVFFDLEASTSTTVCEVHALDDVGLLARIAAVFTDLELDVTAALVSTLGERVVDVFYVRDANGEKVTDPLALDRLRATIVARLTADTLIG